MVIRMPLNRLRLNVLSSRARPSFSHTAGLFWISGSSFSSTQASALRRSMCTIRTGSGSQVTACSATVVSIIVLADCDGPTNAPAWNRRDRAVSAGSTM
jgi:hypothetical protein